ncbi:hypothetical protein MMC21_000167 [Puttea exsequens]|nr:hypothetical protein [Puttea exsequens]
MPRGGKKPFNQHNSKHENGVVAPGKRVTRQKSNGHINGSAEGTSQANGLPPSFTSTAHATPWLPESAVSGEPSHLDNIPQVAQATDPVLSKSSSKVSTALHHGGGEANGLLEHTYRQIDITSSTNTKVYNSSVWQSTLTVLRSCPLGDTISILIVLLSLPPTILSLTNALFAILTFITPTGISSLPTTFNEVFQGSGGTPSLATIFLTDLIGLVLWLVSWAPLQELAIELSQAVVATQLGGGSASKKKGSDRTMLCMGIVTIGHIARHQWIPQRLFGYDWSAILSSIPYVSKSSSPFSGNDFIPARSPAGWMQILFALHILVQGLVHAARRWYQKREYFQPMAVSKKADHDTATNLPNRSNAAASAELVPHAPAAASESTAKSPSTLTRDAREKISSGKKKRKQGTYVRSQQPLWAAFAHTKVTVLREYEQSHSHSEDEKTNAIDSRNLGNARFLAQEGRVWISQILPTSFRFDASHFLSPPTLEPGVQESKINANAAVDRSKPFHVRINDTDWASTRIDRKAKEEDCIDGEWTGDVFGLSPSSSYKCSFVQNADATILYSTTITTPSLLSDENDPSLAAPLAHQVQRPSSPTTPTTTLKNSITVAEATLSESQTRQKRSRKEAKATCLALKKEIDILNSKTAKLAVEEKQHQTRNWQWNEKTKQADDALHGIADEIESLGQLPADDLKHSKDKKSTWDECRERHSLAREALFSAKNSAHQLKSSAQNEATSAQQKKERLIARRTKLNDQHDRLQAATSQGFSEKERKSSEQAAKEIERMQLEQQDYEKLAMLQRAMQESGQHITQVRQQTLALQSAYNEKQMMDNVQLERPLTPEGDLPGTVPHVAHPPILRYPSFGSSEGPNGLRSHSGSLRHTDNRPRSSSLLSGSSTAYVDLENGDPAPPMPPRAAEIVKERGRKQSGGSASGSSGSQRDPASPIVGNGAHINPVGKSSPVWNP